MGSAVSVVGAVYNKVLQFNLDDNTSQLVPVTEYLNSIPNGAASQDKVKFIRLVKKKSLLSHPLIQKLHDSFTIIVNGITASQKMQGVEYGTGGTLELDFAISDAANSEIFKFTAYSEENRGELETLFFWRDGATDQHCFYSVLMRHLPSHLFHIDGLPMAKHLEFITSWFVCFIMHRKNIYG